MMLDLDAIINEYNESYYSSDSPRDEHGGIISPQMVADKYFNELIAELRASRERDTTVRELVEACSAMEETICIDYGTDLSPGETTFPCCGASVYDAHYDDCQYIRVKKALAAVEKLYAQS